MGKTAHARAKEGLDDGGSCRRPPRPPGNRMRPPSLLPLLALGLLLAACRDAARPLAPRMGGPRWSMSAAGALTSKITFQSDRDGDSEIFVMNADGSGVTQLTFNTEGDFLPLWSPDGSRIAYGGNCVFVCDVIVMNADGSDQRAIFHDGFPGAWSPDGNRIAFSRGDGVYVINADGTGLTRVAEPQFITGWSPDGRQLQLANNQDGDFEIYLLNLDGSGTTQLTNNSANDGGNGWSPDGSKIAFESDRDGGDVDIFVMNADGTGVMPLTQNDGIIDRNPVWSPDGTQLAFSSDRDGDQEIFIMNADGSGVTQLTFNVGIADDGPGWVQQVSPPNDDFANAIAIPNLPFRDVASLVLATTETSEPTPSCATFFGPVSRTTWYAFTPGETQSISARIDNAQISTVVAAYTGNSVTGLTEVGCSVFGGTATFRAAAGTTYHFLVGGLFGQGGQVRFHLEAAPPPIASFFFFPSDASVFDVVQFFDQSFDPAGVGFAPQLWTFGDGTTGTGFNPAHRYAADGDYTAQLAVTTLDGRPATTSQTVLVRTHDVAITRFATPNAARSGQTRRIVVGLSSKRYDETVEVQLYHSVPGGFQQFGSLTQFVPMDPHGTTPFAFSYTFTGDDALIGKVTFRAVAVVAGARDALPADNEAIAEPTKVSR